MDTFTQPLKESIARRFWRRVFISESKSCWIWLGSRTKEGYGQISTNRTLGPIQAHRASMILKYGSIPAGMYVLHRCDNPPCVNPDHLYFGTARENAQDVVQRGGGFSREWMKLNSERIARGERSAHAKLTASSVKEIRKLAAVGHSQSLLAKQFGVCPEAIRKVLLKINWRHVV